MTSDSFYVANGRYGSGIYSTTRAVLWQGPEASTGTIAGPYVVYVGSPPNEVMITAY